MKPRERLLQFQQKCCHTMSISNLAMIAWARLIGFEIRLNALYWFNWAGREQELAGLSSDRTWRVQLVQPPITLSSFCNSGLHVPRNIHYSTRKLSMFFYHMQLPACMKWHFLQVLQWNPSRPTQQDWASVHQDFAHATAWEHTLCLK